MPSFSAISEHILGFFDDPNDWWEWGLIGSSIIFAYLLLKLLKFILSTSDSKFDKFCKAAFKNFKRFQVYPILLLIFLTVSTLVLRELAMPCKYVHTAMNLIAAYCVYHLITVFSNGHFVPKVVGGIMYIVLALSIFGMLDPIKNTMSKIAIPIGSVSLNAWSTVSAIVVLLFLLWIVGILNKLIDAGFKRNNSIPPTVRVLSTKALRLVLYLSATLIAVKVSGVDFRALAFFSGALGLGLGFGLQKVISNLISGVIILLDKSIKPGDVIEINGTYGWINTLRTRYVSVLTRDRKEILIPNEDFVTNNVVNWSFSDKNVRIKADVGIAYAADVDKAIDCCEQATKKVTRVLNDPAPRCLLIGFGDSSIDLQIRFWINDANEGVANVRSAVLLEIWRSFKENGIHIPFPQREILIKNPSKLEISE